VSEHFTLDELAELDAGLLAGRRASRADGHGASRADRDRASGVDRHLADCEECSAKADALRNTQERLRDLGPVQMPADVAARLERALGEAKTTGGEDIVPDLGDHRARRYGGIPAWAYAAAAAVVVIGGTAIAIGTMHHTKSGAADTAAGVPLVRTETPSKALVLQESGRTYTPSSLADLATGLANGGVAADALSAPTPEFSGVAPAAPSGGSGGSGGSSQSSKSAPGARGPSATVAPQPAVAAGAAPSIAPSLRHLHDSRSARLRCAAFFTDTPGASPIAVDVGRWTNAEAGLHRVPSVVFVFGDTDDANAIDVFVVAAACDDSSLLDFEVLKNH
jgi:hypothetical protein